MYTLTRNTRSACVPPGCVRASAHAGVRVLGGVLILERGVSPHRDVDPESVRRNDRQVRPQPFQQGKLEDAVRGACVGVVKSQRKRKELLQSGTMWRGCWVCPPLRFVLEVLMPLVAWSYGDLILSDVSPV